MAAKVPAENASLRRSSNFAARGGGGLVVGPLRRLANRVHRPMLGGQMGAPRVARSRIRDAMPLATSSSLSSTDSMLP